MRLFLLGVALGAALYLLVDSDRRYVWQFIERERMTVRPTPRYRPRDWRAG